MPAEHLLQRIRDLAHGCHGPGGIDRQRQQIVRQVTARLGVPRSRSRRGQRGECPVHGRRIAFRAELFELGDLGRPNGPVVDLQHLQCFGVIGPITVDPDDGLGSGVDPRLRPGGRLLDAHLRDPGLDRLGHPASGLDLLDVLPGPVRQVVGQLST